MTKKELVKLLNENFSDDEEVFVSFQDDQGDCVESILKVDNVSRTFVDYDYEINIDGKWVLFNRALLTHIRNFENEQIRKVNYRQWTETKKCICV